MPGGANNQDAWIYALYDNQDCACLHKCRMSQDVTQRLVSYCEDITNFDVDYKALGIIHFNTINFEVDQELGKIL